LASTNETAWELNEVGWWANWADVKWLTDEAYIISSHTFHEYFFNRGGFIAVRREVEKGIALMEAEFEGRGLAPHIFIQETENRPTLLRSLARRGYKISDRMSVMELWRPSFATNQRIKVTRARGDSVRDWVRTYLASFYGKQTLFPAVLKIVEKAAAGRDSTFLLARMGDRPAGELAIFRSEGVCGVYCVGTHPDFRRTGVASTMLNVAHQLAKREGRRLVLQTILSDSTEPFYLKSGFRRAYLKELWVKRRVRS
jgi:GNAT superfamily N-acetyltransferase